MNSHPIKLNLISEIYDEDGKLIKTSKDDYIPEAKDTIELKKIDNNGNIIESRIVPMKSFVRNFLRYFNGLYTGANATGVQFSGGAFDGGAPSVRRMFDVNGGISNTTMGIIIGTGSAAVTSTDYKLGYQLSTAQVSYAANTFESASAYSNGYLFTVSRIFNNITATDFTITEVGMGFHHTYTYMWDIEEYGMAMRDTIQSGSVTMNFILSASQNVEVKYNIYIDGTSGLTRNYIQTLYGIWARPTQLIPFKTVYYNGTTIPEKMNNFNTETTKEFITNAAAGSSVYGIVVGSGSDAFTIDDYKLTHKYEHGATTNTLDYGVMNYAESYTPSSSATTQRRTFINNSGAPLTIREAALYSYGTGSTTNGAVETAGAAYICIARKLTGDLVLQNGQSVDITFVFNTATE